MNKSIKNRLKNEKSLIYFIYLVIALIIGRLVYDLVVYHFTKFEKIITIEEKYTRYRKKASNYNVVDTEGNIYKIDNLWFKFDYNRGDDYVKIKAGQKYKVKGYGFRAGFLHSYKKIYEVEKV